MRSLLLSLTVLAALLAGGWWLLRGGEAPGPESRRAETPAEAAALADARASSPASPAPADARAGGEGAAASAARGDTSTATRALAGGERLAARPLPGVERRERPAIAVRSPAPLAPPAGAEGEHDEGATGVVVPLPLTGGSEADAEARGFIADLTASDPRPLPIERVDHFITQEQVLSLLPESAVESLTAEDLARDPGLGDDTPITVVHEIEQIETTTPERLIAEAAGNLDAPVRVVSGETSETVTVRELLERHAEQPEAPIRVVRRVRSFEITTPAELASEPGFAAGESLSIIRKRYRIRAATIADLIRNVQEVEPDSVFYVRTVRSNDVQGLWGIVHDGIIGNFARGVAIRRGEEVDTYQVVIPRDADERLRDQSSSFLGQMIHDKTEATWVYNFSRDSMGRNPDHIVPGQEVVIVKFRPDELIAIYQHFADEQS